MFAECVKSIIHPATWAVVGYGKDAQGNPIMSHRGTAFAVDTKGHLVTCWHVTYMDADCTVECDSFSVVQPELAIGVQYPARLLGKEKDRDIALLKIDATINTKAVRFHRAKVPFGRSCCAFGHPLTVMDAATQTIRVFTRASAGIVSMPFGGSSFPGCRAVSLYELDFFTYGGASGGPVFLRDGEVFSFVRASLLVDNGAGPTRSNLTVAVDIHEAVEFLKAANVHPQILGGRRR